MAYNNPFAEKIETTELCNYECGQLANYKFRNGKLCCSKHYNSCPSKRKIFSKSQDHKANAKKSLITRKRLGITKSASKKAHETMRKNGTYDVMRKKMQLHWASNPHNNNPRCPIVEYKDTKINYQGTYEYNFLESLEQIHGIAWLLTNVCRGPSIWYMDPVDNIKRLYISDFIINNTIYEIKSQWTWNKKGKDLDLEKRNVAKLSQCIAEGFSVKLILDKKEVKWNENPMG